MTQPSLFPLSSDDVPGEVPWDVFIRALAEAHDKGMSEEQRKARKKRKKGASKDGTKAL